MKCPKCSFTTFDYLDACQKCGGDLREVRTLLQIIAVSPEERAALSPRLPEASGESFSQASHQASDYGTDYGAAAGLGREASEADAGDEALLSDLNFDESFEDLVETTSYKEQPEPEPEPAATKAAPPADDDDLLDLDFGDVFAEEEKD